MAMKKRVDSLTRIGKLASQLHELGRWRLTAIQQEQASLSDDLRAVFESLENGDLAYGAHAKLGARRIRALQRRLDTLERESERVSRAAHVQGVRAKLAEQAAETADKAWREHKARKELAELVELALLRRHASQG
jgi:hypothetical protein